LATCFTYTHIITLSVF